MGTWTTCDIEGHPCDVFQPARPHPHGFTVLYLHGVHLQRLADQPPFVEQFERHCLRVVAPHTGRCWWTDRICPDFDAAVSPERHVLDRVLPWMQRHLAVALPRIGLLGTSMGGQGALRFAYKYPDRFPVVAAISPAIDYQLRYDDDPILQAMYADAEAVRQNTALLHVHPLNWPRHQFFCCDPADERWFESVDRLRMKLWSLGVPFECELETTAGGHGFGYYNAMVARAVGFLVERLERERLRVA
jgi:pimeloyl-ACP methyl ester carboxylesterase